MLCYFFSKSLTGHSWVNREFANFWLLNNWLSFRQGQWSEPSLSARININRSQKPANSLFAGFLFYSFVKFDQKMPNLNEYFVSHFNSANWLTERQVTIWYWTSSKFESHSFLAVVTRNLLTPKWVTMLEKDLVFCFIKKKPKKY